MKMCNNHPEKPYYAKGLCQKCYDKKKHAETWPRLREEKLKKKAEYYKKNPERLREKCAKYYEKHKDVLIAKGIKRYKENRDAIRERNRPAVRDHYRRNKKYYIAKDAARRARKLQATPPWADLLEIQKIYEACPAGYEVDHIVPLRGKIVSGLHCKENLQYLPISENRAKGNKF